MRFAAEPRLVPPNVTGSALPSGALVRLAKQITWPLVPTYTRPLLVAGIVNLVAVPIGADQMGRITQGRAQRADGTALKASSVPAEPLPLTGLAVLTTHTTADLGPVPSEVTTGDPDPKLNRNVVLATSASLGLPAFPTLSFSARR